MAVIGPYPALAANALVAALGAALDAAATDARQQQAPQPTTAAQAAAPLASLEAVLAALSATAGKGGLPVLLGELAAVRQSSSLPASAKEAAQKLMALVPKAEGDRVDPAAVRQAVTQGPDLKTALLELRDALVKSGAPAMQPLIDHTDEAIARTSLLQAVSLPDAPTDKPMRLVFDIPLQTPDGPAVARMAIEREANRDGEDPQQRTWRASFSIDLESLGPVHASIAMQAGRAAVSLVAERPDSALRLRERLPMLHAALGEASLEPGDLECREGTPARKSGPGVLMDRAS